MKVRVYVRNGVHNYVKGVDLGLVMWSMVNYLIYQMSETLQNDRLGLYLCI